MKNKKYTLVIASANETFEITNLTMNGTNYVSETRVDTSAWPSIFALTATDNDGNITEHIDNAKLIQQQQYAWDGNKWYLAFATVSPQERQNIEFTKGINEADETALAGLMATTDLYEELIDKGVL